MDRTAEFKAAVNSLLSRGQFHQHNNSNSRGSQARKSKEAMAYAEFSHLAASIGREIGETQGKLDKLTKCTSWSRFFPSPMRLHGRQNKTKPKLTLVASSLCGHHNHSGQEEELV